LNFKAFCDFVGHTDLSRMTRDDAYRWVDHLAEKDIAKKSIREVWIASLRAVARFQIERGKLTTENPFSRIRVRGVKSIKDSNKKEGVLRRSGRKDPHGDACHLLPPA
jgi:hypothetical protein